MSQNSHLRHLYQVTELRGNGGEIFNDLLSTIIVSLIVINRVSKREFDYTTIANNCTFYRLGFATNFL